MRRYEFYSQVFQNKDLNLCFHWETLEKVEREGERERERDLMKSGENIVKVDHTTHHTPHTTQTRRATQQLTRSM